MRNLMLLPLLLLLGAGPASYRDIVNVSFEPPNKDQIRKWPVYVVPPGKVLVVKDVTCNQPSLVIYAKGKSGERLVIRVASVGKTAHWSSDVGVVIDEGEAVSYITDTETLLLNGYLQPR